MTVYVLTPLPCGHEHATAIELYQCIAKHGVPREGVNRPLLSPDPRRPGEDEFDGDDEGAQPLPKCSRKFDDGSSCGGPPDHPIHWLPPVETRYYLYRKDGTLVLASVPHPFLLYTR